MMYPFLTLDDQTEIVHSQLLDDGSAGTTLLCAQDRSIPVIAVNPDTAEISHLKDGSLTAEIV